MVGVVMRVGVAMKGEYANYIDDKSGNRNKL